MTQDDSYGLIRATLEAEIAAPGILTISSARPRDGKTAVAIGLARSFASAGYRTLLIDAGTVDGDTLGTKLEVTAPPPVPIATAAERLGDVTRPAFNSCDVLSIATGEAGASAVAVDALFAAVRARYHYAIVDTRTVANGGATFARCADGVVLAVHEGRSAATADREAVAILERVRARFLGVVATQGSSSKPYSNPSGDEVAVQRGARPAGDTIGNVAARLRDLFAGVRKGRAPVTGSTTPE